MGVGLKLKSFSPACRTDLIHVRLINIDFNISVQKSTFGQKE